MAASLEKAEFEKLLDQFNHAFETGSGWFDFFHDNASVYVIGSTEPFIGKAAYEDNFKKLLKEKRQVRDLKRDTQVMGDTAVAMQLQQVTQAQVITIYRQSTIWKHEGGNWKVIHMHCALATNPIPAEPLNEARTIKVLTEKMATVAAQTGVAQ
jgi:ketosteroid isomerase-like protein